MNRLLNGTMLALAFTALAACGKSTPAPAGGGAGGGGGAAPAAGGDGKAAAPAGGGGRYDPSKSTASVSGTIKWGGERPKQITKTPTGDAFCVAAHKDAPLVDDRFVVNEDMTIPNCFVFAKDGPHRSMTGFEAPTAFKLEQKGCNYVPHVFGLMVNQKFVVTNDDNTTHNVHVKPQTMKEFNKAQSAGAKDEFFFDKKELAIPFGCDIHTWMSAVCFVLDHPFFAVTDASGKFQIKGLPAGEYTFRVWHEGFSAAKTAGETADFKLTLKDGEGATHDETLK